MLDNLFLLGCMIALGGAIWLIVEAFKQHILWGLGCLLLSPVAFVFVFMHWRVSKFPCLLQLVGIVIAAIALFSGASFRLL